MLLPPARSPFFDSVLALLSPFDKGIHLFLQKACFFCFSPCVSFSVCFCVSKDSVLVLPFLLPAAAFSVRVLFPVLLSEDSVLLYFPAVSKFSAATFLHGQKKSPSCFFDFYFLFVQTAIFIEQNFPQSLCYLRRWSEPEILFLLLLLDRSHRLAVSGQSQSPGIMFFFFRQPMSCFIPPEKASDCTFLLFQKQPPILHNHTP